ncbi:ABC transporter substrate-binding protein [Paenibacillus qinlingensis]|uniref:ABC transporter substrate-binding protein n=1 Tax=Paenibacillus qinlingensis TaxID=1837343 RepID=UPI0015669F56|nr:ABC transporter substrate-binding protein [Paenibacillus qinlingensis]NQX60146.1 ABC transporter substrate-binding protein [Paenibacillus qinlingensis]
MNRKKLLVVLMASSVSLAATACTSNGASTPSSSPKATTPTTNSPAAKKITITTMKSINGDVPPQNAKAVQKINDKFNVDYQAALVPSGSYTEKLNVTLASGSLADATLLPSGELTDKYSKFAKQGAFLALDEYIKNYPSLKLVPDYVWDQFRVNGKVYAIPGYNPKFGFTVVVRKDWLDSLGLKAPTSYEELKQIALAFTKNDPDKNGKNDTYGLAIGKDINWPIPMGAYWDPDAWYHKDDKNRFIPGIVSNARKEMIQWFADLYKEGAMTKDFITLDWAATNKEFYSGKAGIFIGSPRGMSEQYMDGLLKIEPKAQFLPLDAFTAPDGSKGFTASRGFANMTVISAQAGKDPDKVKRILSMLDFSRNFYPNDQKNDKNKDFDFLYGGLGEGYDLTDGIGVAKPASITQGLVPATYLLDGVMVPSKDTDVDYPAMYKLPQLKELTAAISKQYTQLKFYQSPNYAVISPTEIAKGAEMKKYLLDEQSKMIAGVRPVSDWSKLVEEWKTKGGEAMITEINAGIKMKDAKEAWQ